MSMDRDPNLYDQEARVYDRDTSRGSNTLAYLIGGLVLALGLLAFLFYDGGSTGDVSTTGSTSTQTERPAGPTGMGSGSTTAPATPTAPSSPAPASPAPQQ
jgi:hypothetical protein